MLELYFKANLKTIISNHKEWYELIKSKKIKDIEILESYRREFTPFKAEDSLEYATITVDKMIKNANLNVDLNTRNNYIKKLLSNFHKTI